MAIAEQFAGIQMDQLFGAPLRAAVEASLQTAESTAEFIRKVGFDDAGKVRSVSIGYQQSSDNPDGTRNLEEMRVDLPLLSVVPIPNLQVDEVDLLFDIEVKQSERLDSSLELGASAEGKLGALKVGITGSISAHQDHTRSTDNSAKYHVNIRATNHGTPEGLARALDMMTAGLTPVVVGRSLRDENGQALSEREQARAERLLELRSRASRIKRRLDAAREGSGVCLAQLGKLADAQLNVYRETEMRLQGELAQAERDDQVEQQMQAYSEAMEDVRQSWEAFRDGYGEHIRLLADSGQAQDETLSLSALKALDAGGNVAAYADGEVYYQEMSAAQRNALESQRSVERLERELLAARAEYSRALSDREESL